MRLVNITRNRLEGKSALFHIRDESREVFSSMLECSIKGNYCYALVVDRKMLVG